MELFSHIVEVTASIATIAASVFAIYAICSWKKERTIFVETRKIELAEEVLELFYKAIDIIHYMRNVSSWNTIDGIPKNIFEKQTDNATELYNGFNIPTERYLEHSDIFHKIKALRYRCKSRFLDDKYCEPFSKLEEIKKEILDASKLLTFFSGTDITDNRAIEKMGLEPFFKKRSIIFSIVNLEDADPIIIKIKELEKCLDETFGKLILDNAK